MHAHRCSVLAWLVIDGHAAVVEGCSYSSEGRLSYIRRDTTAIHRAGGKGTRRKLHLKLGKRSGCRLIDHRPVLIHIDDSFRTILLTLSAVEHEHYIKRSRVALAMAGRNEK